MIVFEHPDNWLEYFLNLILDFRSSLRLLGSYFKRENKFPCIFLVLMFLLTLSNLDALNFLI